MRKRIRVSLGQHSQAGAGEHNQDFHGALLPQGRVLAIKGVVLALADGISSSRLSHLASETAVRSFLDDYYATSETWSVRRSALRVLSATNSWLHAQTQHGEGRFDKDRGHFCTFSALILQGRTLHLLHVGDSRIYRLHAQALEQLTQGLQALHRREMVHCDLRPENVMIDRAGTVKLIDLANVRVAGLAEGGLVPESILRPAPCSTWHPSACLATKPRPSLTSLPWRR